MTFVSATSVVLFLCLIAQSCPQLNDRSRFPPTTVNNLRPPTLYDLEKYCLYNDKWDLCPEETVTPTGVTSVTENPTSEVNQFLSTLDYELSDAEINNAIRLYRLLQTSHLIPKAIRDLFKYWNWMLMNSPTVYLNENINPAIFNSDGNEYKNYANQLNTVEDRHSADDKYKVSFKNEVLNTRRVGSSSKMFVINMFIHALDHVERTFYATTYAALISISPANRKENGISFALSGLFLQMALIAFSTEVDNETRAEINKFTAFDVTEQDKLGMIQSLLAWLPASSDRLKFKYATRLVLKRGIRLSQNFLRGAAVSAQIKIDYVNGTESVEDLTNILNRMVVEDSEGAMHNTFDEDELAEGVCAVLISTLYVRARWRSPPTLLNGTLPFYVSDKVPKQTRMVRINDMMRYIRLPQWDSEALEIKYATTGLTLFLVVPRGRSLRNLAAHMTITNVQSLADRMQSKRIAAILPLYTLRMTLLLPAKLQAMGVTRLVNDDQCDGLKLSHAVQRIMFWSEAGRYAFKDDGIEWDETPEQTIVFDRPHLFYVRWHNVTILHGNFAL